MGKGPGSAARGNGPVSYTHLDVYKRQPNSLPQAAKPEAVYGTKNTIIKMAAMAVRICFFSPNRREKKSGTVMAVSYTHLDVYKRQGKVLRVASN